MSIVTRSLMNENVGAGQPWSQSEVSENRCKQRGPGARSGVYDVAMLRAIAMLCAFALFFAACTDSQSSPTAQAANGTTTPVPAGNPNSDAETVALATATPVPTPIPPTPTPEGPRPLRVVAMMGETGVMAPIDGPAVAGVVAVVDQLNEAGGVMGQQVQLTRINTDSRTSLADRLAERLLRNPPDLLIVSCDVDFSKPILKFADQNGLLTISPCADDIGYTTAAWGTRNFAFGAPAEPRGTLAAQVAIERYGPTAMVLRDRTSPEALRFCNGFERSFRELGGSVAYRDEFTYDTLDPILDRLKERGRQTDAIVICSHVPGGTDAAPNMIEQLRLLGFEAPIVAGATLDEPTWFAKTPLLGELTYVSWSSIFGNDPNPAVNELIARANTIAEEAEQAMYEAAVAEAERKAAESDQEPEEVEFVAEPRAGATTVLGADAVAAWAEAVEAVRSAEPGRVAASLGAMNDEQFLTGTISFTAGTRLDQSRTYRVIRVADGAVQEPDLTAIDG